jgi:hypothetical protein
MTPIQYGHANQGARDPQEVIGAFLVAAQDEEETSQGQAGESPRRLDNRMEGRLRPVLLRQKPMGKPTPQEGKYHAREEQPVEGDPEAARVHGVHLAKF